MKVSETTRLSQLFNDTYTDEDYGFLIDESLKEMYRVLKNNSLIYIYMNWKELGNWMERMKKVGFNIKNVIVWDKMVHGLNYQNYAYTHEFIIFAKKGDRFPNHKEHGRYKDVWNIQRTIDTGDKLAFHHDTQKQIDVVRIPILHGSNKGDVVLDPFIGSGTTAVACKELGRNFIGIEKEHKYVDLANKRLNTTTISLF